MRAVFLILTACAAEPVVLSDVTAAVDGEVATVLRVQWSQDTDADAVWLAFTVEGEPRTSLPRSRAAGAHEELVLGVPAQTPVTIEVIAEHEGARSVSGAITATTGPLPEALSEPTLGTWDSEQADPAGFLLGSIDANGGPAYSGPFWLFIVDRQGRIVWYRPLEGERVSMFPRIARDGSHIVYDDNDEFFESVLGKGSLIRRLSIGGEILEEIPVPGLGWCWDELPDGTILYDRNQGVDEVTLESISPDGTATRIWDCTAWMAQTDPDKENCYTNTVNWVEQSDSVLWSTYWGDYVVEIDRVSGAVLRHFNAQSDSYTISPSDAGFELQHYPSYTPEGTLLLSTHIPGDETEQQRAREYIVDDDARTLTEVWSYGEGESAYAQYSGEAVRLQGGSTLINYGTGGEVREVSLTGDLLWQITWGEGHTLGHTTLIDDLYTLNAP